MRTTIDSAGRIVIPKAIRDALGLVGGTEVDLVIDGVSIRIDAAERPKRGYSIVDGIAVLDATGGPPVTDEMVREMRLGLQQRS